MRRGERLAALFLLGLAAFSPALLHVFGDPALLLGLPVVFLWIFAAWGGLIALTAATVEGGRRHDPAEED